LRRPGALALILISIAVSGHNAAAYLKLGSRVSGSTVTLRWESLPVRYFVSNQSGGGVTGAQLQQAVSRAFSTWDNVQTAEVSTQSAGMTSAGPTLNDGISVIGFSNRPDQDRVLGATNFIVDTINGRIVEADIFLNSSFLWSVAPAGEAGRFDVESIALHEIGHFLGLGHSALGETELRPGGRHVLAAEAVMFPIAFSSGSVDARTLREDDIAGISDSYPTDEYRDERGSISGTVKKGGQGVLGAHVIAFNTRTGALVGGFALTPEGRFVIGGLEPGTYAIRVEPLDDGDIESFFDLTLGVDTNFQVKFHDRLVVVPRGGGASNVNVQVISK
jgi:hypothetical protein